MLTGASFVGSRGCQLTPPRFQRGPQKEGKNDLKEKKLMKIFICLYVGLLEEER